VVLDTRGGEVQQRSWRTLKPGGILVSIVSAPSSVNTVRYAGLFHSQDDRDFDRKQFGHKPPDSSVEGEKSSQAPGFISGVDSKI
jgi:NADPH:quinone reductase-like Zn-dependent oxidoreductase